MNQVDHSAAEPTEQPRPQGTELPINASLLQALDEEAKRLIVDSTYTGRGHQHAGGRWETYNYWLGLPTAIGGALLAGSAGVTAITDRHPWITAALAFGAAVASATHGFLRPGQRANEHSLKGTRFMALRTEARLFREIDLRSESAQNQLSAKIRELRKRYDDLNETPPLHIPRQDYNAAKESIAKGESSFEDDPIWKELSK
jgi:hypothetical protein